MTTTTTTTDRIQKHRTLRASPARVWRALSDAREFGTWFGVQISGAFTAGATLTMTFEYEGRTLTGTVEVVRVEPERLLAFRWHPYAVEPGVDYAKEPTTLVELAIAPAAGGTLLTVTESGFDALPIARRARALEMNTGGWDAQLENIARHVDA